MLRIAFSKRNPRIARPFALGLRGGAGEKRPIAIGQFRL